MALERFAARFTDMFITISEPLKEWGLNVGIGEASRYVTIYSGIEIDKFRINVNIEEKKRELGIDRNDFVIIGAMVYTDDIVKILVREDKGIRNPLDLIDKKIGITKGSTGQFFLDVFLTHKSILSSEVKTIDLRPSELPQALAEGRVDGICVWEPHILEAKKLLDNSAVVLLSYGIYRGAFYFVANKVFAKNNPETIQSFLKAIEKAEEFIQKNEEESIGIVSQRLKTDKDLTALIWGDFSFQLMLDQTILISLEDIARWAIKERLTDDKEIPNYLDFIYMEALEQVKPRAVTIIR